MSEALPPVLAVIPIRGRDLRRTAGMPMLGGRPLLEYTVEAARRARTIDRVLVSTDSEDVRRLALGFGVEAPFLRPSELASPTASLVGVLRHCLDWLEQHDGYRPALVVRLEMSHPFREEGLIDRVVSALWEQGLDSVFTAYEERHNIWKTNPSGDLEPIVDEHQTRAGRLPLYKEVSGLVCATTSDVIRSGQHLGKRVGVVPLSSLHALVDTQDEQGLELARRLL